MLRLGSWMIVLVVGAWGCGGDDGEGGLLGAIRDRGTVRVATDAAFPPASVRRDDGTFEGFDIDVANALAAELGVSVELVTPDWDVITAGGWGDAWDISVGSMTITTERERVLHFVRPPYYYAPAFFAARADAGIASLDDIAGQPVCVGSETTYESYLSSGASALGLPESSIFVETPPAGVSIVSRPADQDCFDEIAAGTASFSIVLTAETLIDDVIAGGGAIAKVGNAVYAEELAIAVDRSHTQEPQGLVTELSRIVEHLRAEGTLRASSERWFGADLTDPPSGG